jgi:hypothetical protein
MVVPVTGEALPPQNEFGINLFSVRNLEWSKMQFVPLKFSAEANFATGIYYKRHLGKNAIRFSADYQQLSIIQQTTFDATQHSSSGMRKTIDLNAGMERTFGSKRLQLFIFSDLVFNFSNYKGIESYSGCFVWCQNCPFHYQTFESGLDIGAGIKYELIKNISISLETSVQGFYSVNKNILYPNPYGKSQYFDYRINPISKLGVSLVF